MNITEIVLMVVGNSRDKTMTELHFKVLVGPKWGFIENSKTLENPMNFMRD